MNKRYGILIVSVTIFVLGFLGTASATNWSVDGSGGADFTGIQEAINNAKDGDTILVYSGVYYEKVVVNKSVTLKGIGYPVVDAGKLWYGTAIRLTADGITLAGFTATNGSGIFGGAGIAVASNNNNITGNNARHNTWGIQLYDSSNNNTIIGNNASNNWDGIRLSDSSNNTITGNNVCNNKGAGIRLLDSSNNTITGNNVSNNYEEGINIYLRSNNNTITGNNVCNNERYGIFLGYSSNNNTIYFNNVINNTDNVYSSDSTNIWNSPLEMTYTYNGTIYESYLGNYWDDYEGTDTEGDGIGDTPYSIDSKGDESDDYPLMKLFEDYIELVVGEDFL